MAALFRKPEGTTFLLLDIENGSVGAALAHATPVQNPVLLGQTRIELPVLPTLDSALLAGHIERAVGEALAHSSLVASRMRNAPQSGSQKIGDIARAAVFLAAPWGAPNLAQGKPDFIPGMQQFIRQELAGYADVPVSFYTAAGAAGHGAMSLYPAQTALICLVQGEIIELLVVGPERVEGYATLPVGYRSLMRTLQTHAGLTAAEARSALNLTHLYDTYEPLRAAAAHMSASLRPTLEELMASSTPEQVLVIAHGPAGDWLARSLAQSDTLAELFPQGADVRTLGSHALLPHVDARAPHPDLPLMLEALYMSQKFI